MTVYHYAVDILINGKSAILPCEFDESEQVFLAVKYGIKMRRLDGLKTALLMTEIIHSVRVCSDSNYRMIVDNFIKYLYEQFSRPMIIAIVSYAIMVDKIDLRRATKVGSDWARKYHGDAIQACFSHQMPGWLQSRRRCNHYGVRLEKAYSLIQRQNEYVSDSLGNPQTDAEIIMQAF